MHLTRFEPWTFAGNVSAGNSRQRAAWRPAADILEFEGAYLLRLDVPGVDPAGIDISSEKGVLVISGEREGLESLEDVRLTRRERVSGRFERRFSLPESIDIDNIRAQSAHGILEVRIPKLPEVQARKITVEAA